MLGTEQVISRLALATGVISIYPIWKEFLRNLMESARPAAVPVGYVMQSGLPRLYTLVFVATLGAIVGGIIWSVLDKRVFGWNVGAGAAKLSQGWAAVVGSMSMTVPLVVVPVLYQQFAHVGLVLPRHLLAGCVIIVANACGWIIIFGWERVGYIGVKEIIYPLHSTQSQSKQLGRQVVMEVVHTLMNFVSIVVVYRVIVDSQYGALGVATFWKSFISGMGYLTGMWLFVFFQYPTSLVDEKGVEVRGVVAGLLLMITLTGGMLM